MGNRSKRIVDRDNPKDPYFVMKSSGRTGARDRQRQMQSAFEEETAIGKRNQRTAGNPFALPSRRKAFDAAIKSGCSYRKAWQLARSTPPGAKVVKPRREREGTGEVQCKLLPATATREERRAAHKAKMVDRAMLRRATYERNGNADIRYGSAARNRRTGKPHDHAREIARRQRQEARRG